MGEVVQMKPVLAIGDVIDDVLVIPKAEIRVDTDTRASISSKPGGSAGNFACWLASLGVPVEFIGRVGAADLERHSNEFRVHGVKPLLQADSELNTGAIVVLVEGQQRSFLTDRGANKNLDLSFLTKEELSKYSMLYLSGYSFIESISLSAIQGLITNAKAAGLQIIVDPGSSGFIADFGAKNFLDALQGVDILVPSLEEGKLLSGEDRPEVIAEFLARYFPIVAVTLGEAGVCVAQSGKAQRVPAFTAEIVDATGAGDSFAAGLVKHLLIGDNLEKTATEAARVAAKAITIVGGRPKPQKV